MYFASAPKDEIAQEAMNKVTEYYKYLRISNRLYLYRDLYYLYYRARATMGQIYSTGNTGQFLNLDSGDFRNLIQHLKSLTTKARSTFIPISTNTDYKSESQTRVASGILEYYMKDKKIGRLIDQCAELSILYGDSWMCLDWDTSLGETVMVDETIGEDGEPVSHTLNEGDLVASCYSPMDAAIDYSKRSPRGHEWVITRDWVNKYETAAKYPELKDDIEALSDITNSNLMDAQDRLFVFNQSERLDSDLIPLYTLRHKKTQAVPNGRVTKFLNEKILLFDGPLPFRDLNMWRMVPNEEGESAFGYSVSFDLLPICKAISNLYSTLITTESVSGIPIILIPENGNMDITDLANGIKAMTYDPLTGEPKTLSLGQSSPQTYELLQLLKDLSQVVSAINAVARGETPDNLKSGSSLALVLSTAIEFNSGLQRSYAEISEDVGTGMINTLQVYAQTKRMTTISGLSNKVSIQEWSSKDIMDINRVTVELGNPIQQTAGGRMQMAEDLLNKNIVTNAKQYLEVMMTGRLDSMVEDEQAELLYIRQENEELSNGQPVYALVTDEHLEHIRRHRAVMFSKEAKENPDIVNATLNHIQDHINIMADPAYGDLLTALGQAPQPPPANASQPGPASTLIPDNQMPNLPNMPTNPATGQQLPAP